MTTELFLRFFLGGIIVSLFAMLGGALKPKSFAGLFSATPAVALATLSLTVLKKGKPYAATEAQSMIFGAMAFFIYACLVCKLLMQGKYRVLKITSVSLTVWLVCAIGLWLLVFRLKG